MRENADQINSEYGHFLRSQRRLRITPCSIKSVAEFKPGVKSFIDLFDVNNLIYLIPLHASYGSTLVFETLLPPS